MNHSTIQKIHHIVGSEQCTTRKEDLHCYSFDGSKKQFLPELVAFPTSTQHVSELLALATQHKIPVTARGSGSGMTGGSLPVAGGIVLAMGKMNKIIEIDPDNQIAIVEPGVINGDLQNCLKEYGLFYPPDPASMQFCTIGGNVGECAGGPSAVKYGVTKDFVLGLEVVLADGRIIRTGTRTEKGVVGYDLTRLFTGSEGTLGVITQIILRLTPLPECKETYLIQSSDLRLATSFVTEILGSGIIPCTLEYMDKTALKLVADLLHIPFKKSTQAILLVELDGNKQKVREDATRLDLIVKNHSKLFLKKAATEKEVTEIWQARKSISPATFKIKPNKMSEDVVVPRSRIPDLVNFIEKLTSGSPIIILTFGHAGDGNIHVNLMYDASEPEERDFASMAKRKIFDKVLALGGTLSGEHGIGITKSDFISLEMDSETLALSKQLKIFFDPDNILNPGKIFPAEGDKQPF